MKHGDYEITVISRHWACLGETGMQWYKPRTSSSHTKASKPHKMFPTREVNLQPRFCRTLLAWHTLTLSEGCFCSNGSHQMDFIHGDVSRNTCRVGNIDPLNHRIGHTVCFLTLLPQDRCNLASNFETKRMLRQRGFFYPAAGIVPLYYDETNAKFELSRWQW